MNGPDRADRRPVIPSVAPPTRPGVVEPSRRRAPLKIGTPLRMLMLCLASHAVMVPWPLLGILALQSEFNRASESFGFFGGITLFLLMILALLGPVPEEVLISMLMLVWLAAAVVPDLWLRRRLRSRMAIGVLLGIQSAFSLAQALMGALLVIGKSV
ncbi:MAG: hypothetical protein AB7G11_15650 [Phycisphaerales bacterium]